MGLGEARAAGSSSVTWIRSAECEGSKSHVSTARGTAELFSVGRDCRIGKAASIQQKKGQSSSWKRC